MLEFDDISVLKSKTSSKTYVRELCSSIFVQNRPLHPSNDSPCFISLEMEILTRCWKLIFLLTNLYFLFSQKLELSSLIKINSYCKITLHYRFEEVSKRLIFWISKDVQVSEQDKQSLTRKRPKFHVSLNWLLKQSSRLFVEIIRGLKWRRITGDILTDLQVCSKSGDFIRVRSFGWAVIARLLDCPPLNDQQNRLLKSRASWKINSTNLNRFDQERNKEHNELIILTLLTSLSLSLDSRLKTNEEKGKNIGKRRKGKEGRHKMKRTTANNGGGGGEEKKCGTKRNERKEEERGAHVCVSYESTQYVNSRWWPHQETCSPLERRSRGVFVSCARGLNRARLCRCV